MSFSLPSLLPALLAASPLLTGAARPYAPDAAQLDCAAFGENASVANPPQIAQPIQRSRRALVTSWDEWQRVDAEPVRSQCTTKEEPGETTVEVPEASRDEATDDIPNLDPSVLPTLPASTEQAPAEQVPTGQVSTEQPVQHESTPSVAPIPTRTVAPPPSDPTLDPRNFTPTDDSPTPFDGRIIPTLATLPDGSYRYLAGSFEYGNYTDAQLSANGSSVFLLTKVGNQVVGNLASTFGQPGICVTGTVSENTIVGQAYLNDLDDANAPAEVDEDFVPYGSGALQVRQPQSISERTYYYQGALLDLTDFSRINAGTALAPTECSVLEAAPSKE